MNLPSPAMWSVLVGLVWIASAIQFETLTHCIYLNGGPICPGTIADVNKQVTIQAGFLDDSADQAQQAPAWNEETYQLKKIIPNQYTFPVPNSDPLSFQVPGLSDEIRKVTFKHDNCLYINVQLYPWWFAIVPPVAIDGVTNGLSGGHGTQINYNDQRIGCPHKKYEGPEMPNPWNLLNFRRPGHDQPGGPPNHSSGNWLIDKLIGNTEDFTPLYPGHPDSAHTDVAPTNPAPTDPKKKSEVDPSTNDALNADGKSEPGNNEPSVQPDDTANSGMYPSENSGVTANTAITQPLDTAFLDPSLSGSPNPSPDSFAVSSAFSDDGLDLGLGAKTRRSARDFRLRA